MNTRYLALTIGPVFATLENTRSTKAMWAASYLFSWIMREILHDLLKTSGVQLLNLSYRKKEEAVKVKNGVGLFPDRFVARLQPDVEVNMKAIAGQVVDGLAKRMTDDLNAPRKGTEGGPKTPPSPPFELDDVRRFLDDYLRLQAIDFELPDTEHNPVKVADAYLNSLELQAPFASLQAREYLGAFLEDLLYNFFIREEFEQRGFPSTPEIATDTFREHNANQYRAAVRNLRDQGDHSSDAARRQQEAFIEAVREIAPTRFHLCHKYIAIVRADGDNMGHLFKALLEKDAKAAQRPDNLLPTSQSSAERLAEHLADFSLAAANMIRDFGGVPVYAGGDDLLFFAPVSTERLSEQGKWERRDIFHLLYDLDLLFREKILIGGAVDEATLTALKADEKGPSISYGVSISHHKYPLGESLKKAQEDLLFQAIKADDRRNGIAWRVTKHSGTAFGCVLDKGRPDGVFAVFQQLQQAKLPIGEQPDHFLASIIYKLKSLEGLFQATADRPNYAGYFYNILFNNFNEGIHRDKDEHGHPKLSAFLEKVHHLLVASFDENPQSNDKNPDDKEQRIRQNLDTAYAVLRFIHFLDTGDKS